MQIKKTLTIALALAFSLGATAQQTTGQDYSIPRVTPFSGVHDYRTWSVGVWGGASSAVQPFGKNDFGNFGIGNLGLLYGVNIKKQIFHGFGLQAEFMRGKVKGSVKSGQQDPPFYNSFKTNIDFATALSGVFTLGTINWLNRQGTVLPYISAGGGYMHFKPSPLEINLAAADVLSSFDPSVLDKRGTFYIPVGIGAKFNVATGVNIDLSYHVDFTNTNIFDGYYSSGHNDKFSSLRLGVEFALGSRSKPQLAVVNAPAQLAMDLYERNQDLKRKLDEATLQNQQALEGMRQQLEDAKKDGDNDGVADIFDKCPNTENGVRVDGAGCPLPQPKQIIKQEKVVVTQEDRKVVDEAIKDLEFDLGKATIRPTSFPSLDRVAELLVNKNFSLKLAGHTDNTGSNALNMRLSKDRAESVKSYLVAKGANASRIEAVGYGATQPIATNDTEEGRQKNRRVEFTLY